MVRSIETGLYSKWKLDSMRNSGYFHTFEKTSRQPPPCKFQQMSLEIIKELSYLCLVGFLIAFFVYILEVYIIGCKLFL